MHVEFIELLLYVQNHTKGLAETSIGLGKALLIK